MFNFVGITELLNRKSEEGGQVVDFIHITR